MPGVRRRSSAFVERAQLTVDLSDLELRSPIARTQVFVDDLGFHEDLDLAAEEAMATMLDLMEREHGLDCSYALALSSIAVDLRVTQIVNGVKGSARRPRRRRDRRDDYAVPHHHLSVRRCGVGSRATLLY